MKDTTRALIFDMDGTLYAFKDGRFTNSSTYFQMIENTVGFIAKKLSISRADAEQELKKIRAKYGNSISIGIEQEYGINRHDYFNAAWDIDPQDHVVADPELQSMLRRLAQNYKLIILSDAPDIWIRRILDFLQVAELFEGNVFSGEGDIRKSFGNAHQMVLDDLMLAADRCVAIGDEESTDILPAKKVGMKTIKITDGSETAADVAIKAISELENALTKVWPDKI